MQSLTLIGAYLAIFTPGKYAADILPSTLERLTQVVGDTVRGQMIIGGLGSCMSSPRPVIHGANVGRNQLSDLSGGQGGD